MNKTVTFAGKTLEIGTNNESGYLIEVMESPGAVSRSAYKLEGAFLARRSTGDIAFVEGERSFGMPERKMLVDDGPSADSNLAEMAALGIPVITLDQANRRLEASDVGLFNVTAEERARKRGRPLVGEAPMTSTERNKRRMAALKRAAEAEGRLRSEAVAMATEVGAIYRHLLAGEVDLATSCAKEVSHRMAQTAEALRNDPGANDGQ